MLVSVVVETHEFVIEPQNAFPVVANVLSDTTHFGDANRGRLANEGSSLTHNTPLQLACLLRFSESSIHAERRPLELVSCICFGNRHLCKECKASCLPPTICPMQVFTVFCTQKQPSGLSHVELACLCHVLSFSALVCQWNCKAGLHRRLHARVPDRDR